MSFVKSAALGLAAAAVALGAAAAPAAAQTRVLSAEAEAALFAALEDERKAEAFYAAVMEKFGERRPFSNIIVAERRHQGYLEDLIVSYGGAVPANPYQDGGAAAPAAPDSIAEACAIGVEAEIENAALYEDALEPAVQGYADIMIVFERLKRASLDNHLPAFERCGGGGGGGGGQGRGQGSGQGRGQGPGFGLGFGFGRGG